jgi:hypothetical protein
MKSRYLGHQKGTEGRQKPRNHAVVDIPDVKRRNFKRRERSFTDRLQISRLDASLPGRCSCFGFLSNPYGLSAITVPPEKKAPGQFLGPVTI